jgi:alcohol dehydrogenase class IV
MDPGGVRIFHHIEQHLAETGIRLLPHRMDAELLFEVGQPADDKARARVSMAGSAVAALAEALTSSGLVHEQEELDPCSPV